MCKKNYFPYYMLALWIMWAGCKHPQTNVLRVLKWNMTIDSLQKAKTNKGVTVSFFPSPKYQTINSLKTQFINSKSDTAAINAMNDFVFRQWSMVFSDSVIEVIAIDALKKSRGLNYNYGETYALGNLGKLKAFDKGATDSLFLLSIDKAKRFGFKDLEVKALQGLAAKASKKDSKKAIALYNDASLIAQKINREDMEFASLQEAGLLYWSGERDDANALKVYLQALELARKAFDTAEILQGLEMTAMVYQNQKEYNKAISCNLEGIALAGKDTGQIINTLQMLAENYSLQKDFRNALNCLKKIEALSGDEIDGNTLCNIGEFYQMIGDYSNAIVYNKRGIEKSKEEKMDHHPRHGVDMAYASNLIQLAELYCKVKNCSEALSCLNEVSSDEAFNVLKTSYYQVLAEAQLCRKDNQAALNAVDSMLTVDRTNSQSKNVEEFELLSQVYDSLNMPAKAYLAYRRYVQAKDSLHENEKAKEFREVEARASEKLLKAEQEKKNLLATAELRKQKLIRNAFFASALVFVLFTGLSFFAYRQKRKDNEAIALEKEKSDSLLKNILPSEVAEELKANGRAAAKHFDEVTVLFTDFISFTKVSERLTPQQLVDELHTCFSAFDAIMAKHNIEKIKTVGDAYLAVSGLPLANGNHAGDMVKAAIEIRDFMRQHKLETVNLKPLKSG